MPNGDESDKGYRSNGMGGIRVSVKKKTPYWEPTARRIGFRVHAKEAGASRIKRKDTIIGEKRRKKARMQIGIEASNCTRRKKEGKG